MKLHKVARFASTVKLVDPPCIFTAFNQLAELTGSVNLGAGTPSSNPPHFITEAFQKYTATPQKSSSEFSWRWFKPPSLFARGQVETLNDSIANIYSGKYKRRLNAEKNVLVTSGARDALQSTLMSVLGKGDEVVLFDPSYEIYRNSIQKAGAIPVSIPLKPRNALSKSQILSRIEPFRNTQADSWYLDLDLLQRSITPRTKAIIINSPHNPTGKIFTRYQISKLAEIINRNKQITIIEDRVYEHVSFDKGEGEQVPDISSFPGMVDRSVCIFSAGKLLRVKNLMCGWIIASEGLIKRIRSTCPPQQIEEGVQMAVSESLKKVHQPGNSYLTQLTTQLNIMRKALLYELFESKYDFNMWVPQAGYFVMVNVKNIDIDEKYYWQGNHKLAKDYAFCNMLCHEDGVAAIPCSSFFDRKSHQDNYVRFAFCKDLNTIRQAGRRMRTETSTLGYEFALSTYCK